MLVTEINRLTFFMDRVLNLASKDESRKVGHVDRLQQHQGARTGSSKAPTLVSAFDDQVGESWTSEEIIGPSIDLRRITIGLQIMAQSDSPVLIVGESGTCKEVIARSLHALSRYSNLPFVHVNCQLARPEEMLAAVMRHTPENGSRYIAPYGDSHPAARRTVFLEGVSNLSFEVQETVLKALQLVEGEGQESISLVPRRIRLIASSDVNLLDATKTGSFASALYQRLETHLISIPSLRDRAEDMPMLVQRFLEQYSRRHRQPCRSLSASAVELLQLYFWPGNLRELWQVMARFMALREAEQPRGSNKHLSNDKSSLYRQPEAVPELTDLDDCELIVTSLLQTISLRSREPWLSGDE